MTERLEQMITDYKDNGERVDEVLYQEVMKMIQLTRKSGEIDCNKSNKG